MLNKAVLTTTFLLLFALASLGQVPSQPIFSRVTKKEGLASNTIFQTVRDKHGYLWIATQNGLQRYDGNRFLTFRHIPGDSNSLAKNIVNHFFIDSKNRLWLMFDAQVGIFNTTSFEFREKKINGVIGMVRKIAEDAEGRVVMFADNKLFLFDEARQSFELNYPLPPLPTGYSIGDMILDPVSGSYWVTGKQGSFLYNPKAKQFQTRENSPHHPALDSLGTLKNARYPFIAKDGSWWMVTWLPFTGSAPVIYRYDGKNNKFSRYEKIRPYKADSYYEIWSTFQQSNGTLWIYGMGLFAYYDPAANKFVHIRSDPSQQNGIDYDYVSNMQEDSEKNVWVGTNKGLYRFNFETQVFQNISNRRFNDTTVYRNATSTILPTKDNGIWVSTWGAGIFSYDNKLRPIPNPVTAADPRNKLLHAGSMIQRRNGEVWIATQTGEIKIYNPATNTVSTLAHSLMKNETLTQLVEDLSGNVWIASRSGLLVQCKEGKWQDTVNAFTKIFSDITDILKLYVDRKNHVWVCSSGTGVYEIDSKDGRTLRKFMATPDNNKGLLNDGATDIVQYNDSIYLIASDGICILNNNTNTFSYLTPADGIPSEHVTNLIIDKRNRLWVACDGALYRLNINSKLHISYDAEDGITNDIFQVASATQLPEGKIGIGTPKDFLIFDPEKTIDRQEVPLVNITGFMVGNSSRSVDSIQRLNKLTLSYDNTFIKIDLSALNFRDQYYLYYMLEGLDKEWKQVYNNEITYQYLPSGDYTLMLKAQNGEGIESKIITRLPIQINPPFWKTWWFYSVLALLVGLLFFWLDNRRVKRKTAILRMRSNIADDLHQDIDATLSSITILSSMARMKADKEPEKSKEFIEEIHTKSQNMVLAMDDILWSIDPENDSMEKFMRRFREYIDALKIQHNVRIDVLIDKKSESLRFKMRMRNDVFWLFKTVIANVAKSGAIDSRIHITYEKLNLVYTLEFDSTTTDIPHLNNLRQRNEVLDKLDQLNASLAFTEHKTNAIFQLIIPVKRDDL
jgi:ligand-binding sensor domain-containing protein